MDLQTQKKEAFSLKDLYTFQEIFVLENSFPKKTYVSSDPDMALPRTC